VIEDPHERTRAILWLLCDIDPGMPLAEALGHLKAVEGELMLREAEERRQAELDRRYSGMADRAAAQLASDLMGDPQVARAAEVGLRAAVHAAVQRHAPRASDEVTEAATTTLLHVHAPPPDIHTSFEPPVRPF
jgi:hypothetical protein